MARPDEASDKRFRVIIVGAGLVGLSLSHALQLANIEHVVLEKHDKIVSVHGAALTIFPSVARIFDQFGILNKIQKLSAPIDIERHRWPDGSVNIQTKNMKTIEEKFELPVVLFNRQECVTHLYDNLPDQSMIRTSARVDRIEHTETGVKVYLTDGSFEEGDIVIGADGVHSLVRQVMWDYAAENDPGAIPESDKKALFTEFRGIFGVSDPKKVPNIGSGNVEIICGHETTKLLFTTPTAAYWSIVFKGEYSQPPKPYRPNLEEQEEVAQRFKDIKFTESLTMEDLWKGKTRSGLLNVEEGILDKWHAGRIVLVGDSAHKMTADLGIGANMAIESAVVLSNILQRSLASNPNRHFTTDELSTLFQEYQSKRHPRAKAYVTLSGSVTRMRSYYSFWGRIFITRIATLPWMRKMQMERMMLGFTKGPKLEYVKTRTINENAEGWQLAKKQDSSKTAWVAYALITSAMGVALSYVVVLKWSLTS
jgi:FAD dependent monooxygenase